MKRLALAVGLAATACFSAPKVTRVYDGRIAVGNFVSSEGYAAYLRGVLAEEAGDLRAALAEYEATARDEDEDPEPYTRIGDVRCRLDSKSPAADDAFAEALRIDPTYAPALAARARCAAARGRPADAIAELNVVAPADRKSTTLEALFVTIAASSAAAGPGRERAIALTLASGEHPAAWDALVAWGRGKGDPELVARGLEGLVTVAPTRSAEVEAGAVELLGTGQLALARRVAARLADASSDLGITGVRDATVARLAVDEAIVAGDLERADRRAKRGRVPASEVAARALLLERPDLARTLARGAAAADPGSSASQMVLAVLSAREGTPSPKVLPASDRPPALGVLVVAERLAAWSGVDAARAFVARAGEREPMAAHDPLTGPLAVDLAARGVVNEATLPLELRIELAARRREPPPAVAPAEIASRAVDARHALLWHALVAPTGAPAKTLLARMAGVVERDPIVGYALGLSALAADPGPGAWTTIRRVVAAAPADPLLAALALEVAKRVGRAEEVPPARVRLMAVAKTPAERALARE